MAIAGLRGGLCFGQRYGGVFAAVLTALAALCWQVPNLVSGSVLSTPADAAPAPAASSAHYELAARLSLSHGLVKDIAWQDSDRFLTLVLSPDGAAVWRTSLSSLDREKYMSSQFVESNVCAANLTSRLSWVVSPQQRYVLFLWFQDDSTRQSVLVDVSAAPQFRVRRFSVPEGMQVVRGLFSPDERYLVLVHDTAFDTSDISILVLDLQEGSEVWRIATHELSFIGELWWCGANYDKPEFSAVAGLHDGQFTDEPGLATCDITSKQLAFAPTASGLLCGFQPLWGMVTCHRSAASSTSQFYLEAEVTGQPAGTIPLTAEPVELRAMNDPGLVLLSNTADHITNQLWLIDVLGGDKLLVDNDCAGYDIAPDGKLLVRSKTTNELRVYELIRGSAAEGEGAGSAAAAPTVEGYRGG